MRQEGLGKLEWLEAQQTSAAPVEVETKKEGKKEKEK